MIVIPKNRSEEVRVSLDDFRGTPLLNIRTWYLAQDGEMRPGKQGIAMGPDRALEVAKAICTIVAPSEGGGD